MGKTLSVTRTPEFDLLENAAMFKILNDVDGANITCTFQTYKKKARSKAPGQKGLLNLMLEIVIKG